MEYILNTFLKKREEATRIYNHYSKTILFSLETVENNVVRKEFSRGGECLHRGFYCPSPVIDIVVGGCKRGKLIKKPKKTPDLEYWFAADDNMILAKKPNIPEGYDSSVIEYELIYYYDNYTESVIFHIFPDKNVSIIGLTKCLYQNGFILSYDYMSISEEPFCCNEIRNEEYFYNDGKLISSIMQSYNFDFEVLDSVRFCYSYNSSGKIISYTIDCKE